MSATGTSRRDILSIPDVTPARTTSCNTNDRSLTSLGSSALLSALLTLSAFSSIHAQHESRPITIPAGTTLEVETLAEISTRQPAGTKFEARLQKDLHVNDRLVAPAGTPVYGVILMSQGGQKVGKQVLATTLNQIKIAGHVLPIVTDTAVLVAKPGGGLVRAGGGTIRGAMLGGPAGAVIGGVAGTAVSKASKDRHITMPAGKVLEVHLRTAVHAP